MEQERTRILLVEDNPGDARLLQVYLREAGAGRFDLTHADSLAGGIEHLRSHRVDLVLLDLSLPDAHGMETVRRAHAAASDKPIVVLTGLDDEAVALDAVRAGAQDYLIKGRIDSGLLVRAIRYAIERKRINIELGKLNELKNQLLGMAAHDLRNPLSVILSCSDFLLDDASESLTEEQHRSFLRRIKDNTEFMARLIDDLLDVSRIESGKLELDVKPTDLVGLVEHNLELNRMLARAKDIELVFAPESAMPEVPLDGQRIEQVLNNLVSNAVKFSQSGTRIEVGIARQNGSVVVSVQDQGQGIPAGELGKLFRPFARTCVQSTGGEKCTGLGLAIARKIVEGHHGRIWVDSEVGKGTTFRFAVPAG